MRIDTTHTATSEVVTIVLESDAERGFSDEELSKIAFSQDRLHWLGTSSGKVECRDTGKLRTLPPERICEVERDGDNVQVLSRERQADSDLTADDPLLDDPALDEPARAEPDDTFSWLLTADHAAALRGMCSALAAALFGEVPKNEDVRDALSGLSILSEQLHKKLLA